MKSVALTLGRDAQYSEGEIDELLQSWLDHVNLRRRLVDERFLERTRDGSAYWMGPGPTGAQLFDASVEECDPYAAILSGKTLLEKRKVEYLERSAAH